MAEGSSTGKGCLIALLGVSALTVVSCGCMGLATVFLGPQMAMDAMVEDEPLKFDHPASSESSDAIRQQLADDLSDDRTTRLTGPQLTRLLEDAIDDDARAGVAIDGGVVTFDASLPIQDQPTDPTVWLNIHARGSFEMQQGMFTNAHVDEFEFSGWDVSTYLQDDAAFVQQLNQQLVQRRMQEPDLDEFLDAIESARSQADAIEITLTEDGLKKVQGGL